MKKTYTKPALYAESFEMAEHIAACSGFTGNRPANNHWNASTCAFMTENSVTYFMESTGGCLLIADDPSQVYVDCYNTPGENMPGVPFSS